MDLQPYSDLLIIFLRFGGAFGMFLCLVLMGIFLLYLNDEWARVAYFRHKRAQLRGELVKAVIWFFVVGFACLVAFLASF